VLFVSSVRDVTERKRAAMALQERRIEMLTARSIQEHLFPADPPLLSGFDIGGARYPAAFTAGDYLDYLPMPDGSLGFAIGDVSGHGIGPALITAFAHAQLQSLAKRYTEVDEILAAANSILCEETQDDLFVTLLLVRLDPRTRSLVYANAGHPTGYVLDSSGDVKDRLESTDFPLGIIPDTGFPVHDCITLEPGNLVLLLTDGAAEARSRDDRMFGTEQVLEIVRSNRSKTSAQIVMSLYRAVQRFSGSDTLLDDVTALVIKVQPVP